MDFDLGVLIFLLVVILHLRFLASLLLNYLRPLHEFMPVCSLFLKRFIVGVNVFTALEETLNVVLARHLACFDVHYSGPPVELVDHLLDTLDCILTVPMKLDDGW